MISRRQYLAVFALTLATVFGLASPAFAGSKKPNPTALQKAAGRIAEEQQAVDREKSAFLHKLATDAEYAKAFDNATYKADKPELYKLIKAGGITHETVINSISKDLRITITIRGRGWSVTITISW